MPGSQISLAVQSGAVGAFGTAASTAQAELSFGLLQRQAKISPKYFYDAQGSELFESICLLDEYYLTRAEAAIFAANALDIALVAGRGAGLIDLGAGNCAKAESLFAVLQPEHYIAVDISADFVAKAVVKLQADYPAITMRAVGTDFAENLTLPVEVRRLADKLFFYPGSSIGNFTPLQAAQFLTRVRGVCGDDGGLLIGVDLIKDAHVLEAAYDDALGVTGAFNLNILRHANKLLGSNFDVRNWRHVAVFNAAQSRVEMHLEARSACKVTWPGDERHFAAGERIHTENSYKYSKAGFVELLQRSGFGDVACWTDQAETFLVCHARAA
jgi:dimethylhistidine N-methyltransferase